MKTTKYQQPTQEQIEALRKFAAANGRSWKSKLNHCWMRSYYGDYPGVERSDILQGIRNELGPTWLDRFKLTNYGEAPKTLQHIEIRAERS